MAEAPAELNQIEIQQSQIDNDVDLWPRLRESMARLASIGERKSDPAALAEKLATRAKQLRGRMASAKPAAAPLVFVAFSKGQQRYGIPVSDVVEVQAMEQFCPVPGTPPFIAGVIHWRGDVLSLLDLGKLFGIPESGLADIHVCLIVEAAGGAWQWSPWKSRISSLCHELRLSQRRTCRATFQRSGCSVCMNIIG